MRPPSWLGCRQRNSLIDCQLLWHKSWRKCDFAQNLVPNLSPALQLSGLAPKMPLIKGVSQGKSNSLPSEVAVTLHIGNYTSDTWSFVVEAQKIKLWFIQTKDDSDLARLKTKDDLKYPLQLNYLHFWFGQISQGGFCVGSSEETFANHSEPCVTVPFSEKEQPVWS